MKSRTTFFRFCCIIVLCCLSAACKKDSSASRLMLLTSGTWTLQNWEEKNSSGAWVEETHDQLPHYVLTFNKDHTCTLAGNPTIGQWEANGDYTHITITNSLAVGSYDVTVITSSTLTLDDTILGARWIYRK